MTHKASSLNYGENIGNVSILKKLTLGDGTQITYVSDKALKYEIRRKGREEKGWKLLDGMVKEWINRHSSPGGKKNERTLDVDSFGKGLVREYQEFDLLGGLFTNLKLEGEKVNPSYGDSVKRTAPVKLSYALSISKFEGDMDFMNNIDAYNRYIKHIETKEAQVIAQSEEHSTHYYYTIAVDLDRIGIWEKEDGTEEVLDNQEKAQRVKDLLDIIRTLSRQIKGRWENLSPIFVIGGIYKVKNPFFMDAILAREKDGLLEINVNRLLDSKNLIPEGERENTLCGVLSGYFANEEELRQKLNCRSVAEVFDELKRRVDHVYGVSQV
ncbi:type I-B CRISPR-associated protein Cas7/Cst2/DevR [Thermocrinis sp.]